MESGPITAPWTVVACFFLSHPHPTSSKPLIYTERQRPKLAPRQLRSCRRPDQHEFLRAGEPPLHSSSQLIMRLIRASTLEIVSFIDDRSVPPYAILSHTWGEDEVSFQDMTKPRRLAESRTKRGYKKVELCAKQAAKDRLEYCWVDTCCIDKTSSSELSEAINSMFRWYKNAKVCYAYLSDVTSMGDFFESRWFTRGWTLQELIAPENIVFYGNRWSKLGSKSTLMVDLTRSTNISLQVLQTGNFAHTPICERMSWNSGRKTSRIEDMAYCMMGLFGINMPMLYGEGERAFIRLQEEIMKQSDDMTIFCWKSKDVSPATCTGLLARSPTDFAEQKEYVRAKADLKPFRMTNKGLKVQLVLVPREGFKNEYIGVLPLAGDWRRECGVYLIRVEGNTYLRTDIGSLWPTKPLLKTNFSVNATWTSVFVPQSLSLLNTLPIVDSHRLCGFRVESKHFSIEIGATIIPYAWYRRRNTFTFARAVGKEKQKDSAVHSPMLCDVPLVISRGTERTGFRKILLRWELDAAKLAPFCKNDPVHPYHSGTVNLLDLGWLYHGEKLVATSGAQFDEVTAKVEMLAENDELSPRISLQGDIASIKRFPSRMWHILKGYAFDDVNWLWNMKATVSGGV